MRKFTSTRSQNSGDKLLSRVCCKFGLDEGRKGSSHPARATRKSTHFYKSCRWMVGALQFTVGWICWMRISYLCLVFWPSPLVTTFFHLIPIIGMRESFSLYQNIVTGTISLSGDDSFGWDFPSRIFYFPLSLAGWTILVEDVWDWLWGLIVEEVKLLCQHQILDFHRENSY